VHIIAKELGVASKAIIEKCHAEGIDLKNHMAAISVGLSESIREWFSTGEDVTSIELAEHVDVEQARKTRRKTRKKDEGPEFAVAETTAGADVAVEVGAAGEIPAAEAEEEAAPSVPAAVPAHAEAFPPAPEPITPVAPTVPELPVQAATVPVSVAVAAESPTVTIASVVEAPAPPFGGPERIAATAAPAQEPLPAPAPPAPVIQPAGPKLVPAPAELRGPKVVRIEAPEPDRVPRPRTGIGRTPWERPAAAASTTTTTTTAAPRRGRVKGRKTEEEEASAARSRSPRRHGPAVDVDQRVREWRDQDLLERKERLASVTGHGLRDRRAAERRRQSTPQAGGVQVGRREPIAITAPVSVKAFCSAVGTPFVAVSKKLVEQTGRLWTINQTLDAETVELLALDLGVPITVEKAKTAYERLEEEFANRERPNLQPRPPVVAMLGHVDHGKTSLLDAIRKTQVAAGEAGGITQHIGAYRIDRGDWHVTFIDTPGHEAFTAMRARGANLTDVVVLVVAADDGVMPQTVEAIAHARAAGVAIVVALNKIDLPGIDLNRIYAQLAAQNLTPTEWGGETDVIKTSATTGEGIDELIAHLSTLSELLDLQADATVPTHGAVIESQMREGRGVVVKVLVREGTLRPAQTLVCGPGSGRVRALRDHNGRTITEAGPGTPVEVSGLDELPAAGDRLYQVGTLSIAKVIAAEVKQERRAVELGTGPKPPRSLEAFVLGEAEAGLPVLNVIVRADMQGSVEVLRKTLGELPANKARLNLLHAAVGAISEADVNLAKASRAMILGFHVVPEDRARQLAEQLGVQIRQYRVIYELLDDLRKALTGLLAPIEHEEIRATVEVRQVFNLTRVGIIAGCYVTDGTVNRSHRVRVVRDGRVVMEGKAIASLKRFKDDAREVRAGMECGVKIQDFDDLKPHDVLQAYELVAVAPEL
jgi:translation initiation factor IF-2